MPLLNFAALINLLLIDNFFKTIIIQSFVSYYHPLLAAREQKTLTKSDQTPGGNLSG